MANFELYDSIDVLIDAHQYPILICRYGLSNNKLLQSLVHSSQVLLVTNTRIAPLYLKNLESAFASIQCDTLILPDGEQYKNQQSLFAIYETLIQKNHHRDTTIIALGGGVIGDITGFAASTYQRGVNFIQIPTSLLAQVDASVGGKTAINHPMAKNLIGSFYQPQNVLIDLATLATLPAREFRAGLAEIIKYGLLVGGDFFDQIICSLQEGLNAESPKLPSLISKCCRIKADIVRVDEKEKTGQRALLNLGHTFAHALEAYTNYQSWLHGEAVAIGLYCATVLSYKLHLTDIHLVKQVKHVLEWAGLPYTIPQTLDLKKLIHLMALDKKIKDNFLHFVLIKEPGHCFLQSGVSVDILYSSLLEVVQGE